MGRTSRLRVNNVCGLHHIYYYYYYTTTTTTIFRYNLIFFLVTYVTPMVYMAFCYVKMGKSCSLFAISISNYYIVIIKN